jgi:hypothetical protein
MRLCDFKIILEGAIGQISPLSSKMAPHFNLMGDLYNGRKS